MSSDPYSTSPAGIYDPAAKLPPEGEAPRPQYFAALNYVFEHPDWAMSLLLGSVCMIIPILNSLILLGYRYEIVEMKVRFPDQLYPQGRRIKTWSEALENTGFAAVYDLR